MREYTVLLLDRGSPEDMDKIGWLLKQLEQLKDGPDVQVEQARLLTRKGQAGEAEEVLKRIVKRDPKHHAARAALGEACFARGQVFQAAKAYQLAQQDAPSNAVERIAYQVVIDQLTSLIESGEALTIERAASEEEKARALALEPVASDLSRRPLVRERPPRKPRTARPRREPKADGSAPDETDESVSPEGAPSEEPVPEESVPEESVPEEPDVVEPGEPS
jgi:tetratricopeptide (TPR) repeat protein